MCGRYSLHDEQSFSQLKLPWPPSFRPSRNIAPTDDGVVLIAKDAKLELDVQQWGLLPDWVELKEVVFSPSTAPRKRWVRDGPPLFNVRDDQLDKRWKRAFETDRCLVVANGFYEWSGPRKRRLPHYLELRESPLLFMGGIWTERETDDGELLRTFSIVTCGPNELVAPIHPRMPVIVSESERDTWLFGPPEQAQLLLRPFDAKRMRVTDVDGDLASGRERESAQPKLSKE